MSMCEVVRIFLVDQEGENAAYAPKCPKDHFVLAAIIPMRLNYLITGEHRCQTLSP